MLGLGAVLEITTIVSAVAQLALFVFSMLRNDGPAWTAFRFNVMFPMVGAFAAAVAIARIDFSTYAWESVAGVALIVVSTCRAGQATSSLVMAFHLRASKGKRRRG